MVSSKLNYTLSSPRLSLKLVMLVLKSEEPPLRLKSELWPLSPLLSSVLKEENTRKWPFSYKRDSVTLITNSPLLPSLLSKRVYALLLKLKPWNTNWWRKFPLDWLLTTSSSPSLLKVPRVVKLLSLVNWNNKEPRPWNSSKDTWFALVNLETTTSIWPSDTSSSNKVLWVSK